MQTNSNALGMRSFALADSVLSVPVVITENCSGLDPADQRVVVLRDEAPDKAGSLFVPEQVRDKQKFAMQTATIVAMGPLAWAEGKHDCDRFGIDARWFEVGDRVRIGKYTGQDFDGPDGKTYTLLNDTDVLGHLSGGR